MKFLGVLFLIFMGLVVVAIAAGVLIPWGGW